MKAQNRYNNYAVLSDIFCVFFLIRQRFQPLQLRVQVELRFIRILKMPSRYGGFSVITCALML